MITSSRTILLPIAAIVALISYIPPFASHERLATVSGCQLLSNPTTYNGKLVRIHGLIHSDYEHFDLRFKCKGYIQLETSTTEADLKKFGFKTLDDANYKELLRSAEDKDAIGTNCLQCTPKSRTVHATIEGLFRCHYDFPDCSNVSRQGDSSLVISSVISVLIGNPSQGTSPGSGSFQPGGAGGTR
jgi:hypothetical protein